MSEKSDKFDAFPNLGDPPFGTICKNVALVELEEAGVPRGAATFSTKEVEVYHPESDAAKLGRAGIVSPDACSRSKTVWVEVHDVSAEVYGWTLHRSWYLWDCRTINRPLRQSVAMKLFSSHGEKVRVGGSCTCPAPVADTFSYHVDTPSGLKALVEVLKQEDELLEAAYQAELERKYGK